MSIAIIANPAAGRGRGTRVAQEIEDQLIQKAIDYEIIYTSHHRHAIELAKQASQKHEIVAALGGDGTIGEVLEGIYQTDTILGIIPGGTGNDYARGLGIPLQPSQALETILAGQTHSFDIGAGPDKVFGCLASIGFPVSVIQHVNDNRNGFFKGPAAILASVISTLRTLRSYQVKIKIDGHEWEQNIVGIMVMNTPYGGGGLKFAPNAKYDDGKLSAIIFSDLTKWELAKAFPKLFTGSHIHHPAVSVIQGKQISVTSEPLPIMYDGDVYPPVQFQATLLPQAGKIRLPKTPID